MHRADLEWISPNDYSDWWEGHVNAEVPEPEDAYGSFTVSIGEDDSDCGEDLQVTVATATAVPRAQGDRKFRGVVVPRFDRHSIERALSEHVSSITGESWENIRDHLRTYMLWEYEFTPSPKRAGRRRGRW